jgi:hypothetical protein
MDEPSSALVTEQDEPESGKRVKGERGKVRVLRLFSQPAQRNSRNPTLKISEARGVGDSESLNDYGFVIATAIARDAGSIVIGDLAALPD